MLGRGDRSLALGCLVVMMSLARVGAADLDPGAYEKTVNRALALLPRQPAKVLVVDDTSAARAFDAHGRRVEAFVKQGETVVYLVAQGATLQRARKEPGIFDFALATIIWHEMAHVAGATEQEAQRQEEGLWEQYVVAHRVDAGRGLRYLALLRKRH
jgi:hypothetical protein